MSAAILKHLIIESMKTASSASILNTLGIKALDLRLNTRVQLLIMSYCEMTSRCSSSAPLSMDFVIDSGVIPSEAG